MRCAIYPGTFDPITLGHIDMVKRAAPICDKLIVGVARSTPKNVWFSIEERVELVREAFQGLEGVEVRTFEGLLVDFAKACGAGFIVRGVRAFSDFEYELQMALINRKLAPDVETLFLMPAEEFSYVSSSRVREIAALNGDVRRYVTPGTYQALLDKIQARQETRDTPRRSAAGG
ncbi:MAG: pantetheine-phosphate adenylyltransferase [Verrucomicrobia bacterium]|nr:pantetheine-phosphate adenylyltransferase [Verrucomicrobiota bacterium]MCH8510197.1 pantetheine-phosphate adenylyltransferase [Kiritimatiellia bacterium]